MIGKQTKGRGFRGALNYVLSKEGAQLIGGNMLGDTARELASEFAETRKLRPNVKRAVYHASLSLPHGETLTDDKWRQVSTDYMDKMGFKNSQFVIVKHTDSAHSHVHIIASRISLNGKVVSDSKDYQRSESILRGFEKEYGLTPVTPSRESLRRGPSRGELETMVREGIPSTKLKLQMMIDHASRDRPSMNQLFERLEASKVEVIPNVAKTGHISGISFRLDGELMKGSDLGRGYSWNGLLKKGITNDLNPSQVARSRAGSQHPADTRKATSLGRTHQSHSQYSGNRVRENQSIRESLESFSRSIASSGRKNRSVSESNGSNSEQRGISYAEMRRFLSTKSERTYGTENRNQKHDRNSPLDSHGPVQHPEFSRSRRGLLDLGAFASSTEERRSGMEPFSNESVSKTRSRHSKENHSNMGLFRNEIDFFETRNESKPKKEKGKDKGNGIDFGP